MDFLQRTLLCNMREERSAPHQREQGIQQFLARMDSPVRLKTHPRRKLPFSARSRKGLRGEDLSTSTP